MHVQHYAFELLCVCLAVHSMYTSFSIFSITLNSIIACIVGDFVGTFFVYLFIAFVCLKCFFLIIRIRSERYSGLPDEGVIINAVGVTLVAITAVVMYIVSRDKFRTVETRDGHIRASVNL